MMDWSDRHYRFFMRQINSRAFLYTEMITTGALIHGEPLGPVQWASMLCCAVGLGLALLDPAPLEK